MSQMILPIADFQLPIRDEPSGVVGQLLASHAARSHPKLKRGVVWCTVCGRSEQVDSAACLRTGWPKCCGQTMTIDSPKERGISCRGAEAQRSRTQPGPMPRPVSAAPLREISPRPRARKIRHPLGPFQTTCSTFNKGKDRKIEIISVTPSTIVYRCKGMSEQLVLPHDVAILKAMAIAAGFNADARKGGIRRGGG